MTGDKSHTKEHVACGDGCGCCLQHGRVTGCARSRGTGRLACVGIQSRWSNDSESLPCGVDGVCFVSLSSFFSNRVCSSMGDVMK